ncbi:CHAT domain-containing protein [Actinoplanes sp. CA-030573]|uniref:CHAT domain-containing protein n=1 Tax=Actinoplanes sp. CA-030573 TaxID=3239898 RepID=UPI003D910E4C
MWRLAFVVGDPGPDRDSALDAILREAPTPVRRVDGDRGAFPVATRGTMVVEIESSVTLAQRVIRELLDAGLTVVIVTRSQDLAESFPQWSPRVVSSGPPIDYESIDFPDFDFEAGLPDADYADPGILPAEGIPAEELERWPTMGLPRPEATPEKPDLIPAVRRSRVVSVAVVDGAGRAATGGLPPELPFLVRVGIGAPRAGSILPPTTPPFPEELLGDPDEGWWLQAVLSRDGQVVQSGAIFLPRTGEGFVCSCTPGDRHRCTESDRSPWLSLSVIAPRSPGVQQLQLALHLGAAAIQAFEIEVAVGDGGPAPVGRAVFTLSKELAELDRFGDRAMSIRLGDLAEGRHYLVVNDAAGTRVGTELSDAQAGDAARSLRAVLFDRQLSETGGGWRSLYDDGFAKSEKDYVADLWAMARAGSSAYLGIFPDVDDRLTMRRALAAGSGPATIQVALAEGSRAVIPWQLVYDLPIQDGAGLCPSVHELGPAGAGPAGSGGVPDRCPHAAGHDQRHGVLCPYGFWGLAHVLEVPPSSGRMTLAAATSEARPAAVVVGLNAELAGADWDRQRAVLDRLGAASVVTTDVEALRDAVIGGADLLYLFCHGRRVTGAGSSSGGLALDFGRGGTLRPEDVSFWAELSPAVRWESRRPLVVLNGCYTGERLPETLTDFASAFVRSTGAAGVLATEVTMEQRLAAYAMSAFVAAWGSGGGVGAAMRQVRWQLLARGNVMGLAYSPYCDAGLRLP